MATLFFLTFLVIAVVLIGGGVIMNLSLRRQSMPETYLPRRRKTQREQSRIHTAKLHDVLFQKAA